MCSGFGGDVAELNIIPAAAIQDPGYKVFAVVAAFVRITRCEGCVMN
jgi:hypothetical protein